MTNIQLTQRFCDIKSEKLFDKIHHESLSHLLTFVKLKNSLTDTEIEDLEWVINKVTEWRSNEKELKTRIL